MCIKAQNQTAALQSKLDSRYEVMGQEMLDAKPENNVMPAITGFAFCPMNLTAVAKAAS